MDIGGIIPGKDLARSVFPAPGGPTIKQFGTKNPIQGD